MYKLLKKLSLLLLTTALSLAVSPRTPGWVKGKLQSMTLKEKIGQMFMVDVGGQTLTKETKRFIENSAIGGVILFSENITDQTQTKLFIKQLQNHSIINTGVPLLVSVDQEGGSVNRLGEVTSYKTMDYSARTIGRLYKYSPLRARKLVNRATSKIARKMRNLGFNMNMAPVMDLTNNKENYIYERSYGDNPHEVSNITSAYIETMHHVGIATTGKHFPNLGKTKADSHMELPVLNESLESLKKHEFVPFMEQKNNLAAIMVGHVVVPSLDPRHPASISPEVINHLRNKIGFKGVIVSDDIKMGALSQNYGHREIAIRAARAGVDLIIMAWDKQKQREAMASVERAVLKGVISRESIDDSVTRILGLKYKFAKSGAEQ